jgi:hypothetical protein
MRKITIQLLESARLRTTTTRSISTPPCVRRVFLIALSKNGYDIRTVQEQLGLAHRLNPKAELVGSTRTHPDKMRRQLGRYRSVTAACLKQNGANCETEACSRMDGTRLIV